MTDFAPLLRPDRGEDAVPIHLLTPDTLEPWLGRQDERARTAIAAQRFTAKPGESAILPGDAPADFAVAAGTQDGPWALAPIAARLPAGTYRLGEGATADPHGWLMAQHRMDRYRTTPDPLPRRTLLTGDAARIDPALRLAEAVALVRDMVDTPAADMGPAALARLVAEAGAAHGATVEVTEGAALAAGYPMIHAVGRAAAPHHAPRLISLEWGDPAHPRVAIVGKGVCFDSGGLDLKPSAGMRLMKKDMGGAAHALALARLVMQAALPVRLHLLIPAVENAVSGDAFRPGDVLHSRHGLTVEITNTDAEGRLVLADALALACETPPALLIDFATLTGAARVALGPDLPPLFCTDETLADDLLAAGRETGDPLWRMPLWDGYADMLKSDVADIANAADSAFAGAVTAALFLKRFVGDGIPWAHVDTFAWAAASRPGRPRGGAALGLSAAWRMLSRRFPAG